MAATIARFCVRCGTPNVSASERCANCGNSLTLGAPPPPSGSEPSYPRPPPTAWEAQYPPPIQKPATAGNIVGDTLRVYAKDFLAYILVFLLFGAATTGMTLALTAYAFGTPADTPIPPIASFSPSALYVFIALAVSIAIVGAVVQSVITAALTFFAVQRFRRAPVSLGKAFEVAVSRFLSVLGASLVTTFILGIGVAVGLGVFLVAAATRNLSLLAAAGIFFLAFLPIALYVFLALSLAAPAIMMEGKRAIEGLRRSWELTRHRRLTLFGAQLVVGLLAAVVGGAISLPVLLSAYSNPSGSLVIVNPYVSAIATVVATGITGAWGLILAAVAYQLILSEPPMGAWPGRYAPPPAPLGQPFGTAAPPRTPP